MDIETQDNFVERWIYPIVSLDFGKIGENIERARKERKYRQLEKAGVYYSLSRLEYRCDINSILEGMREDIELVKRLAMPVKEAIFRDLSDGNYVRGRLFNLGLSLRR